MTINMNKKRIVKNLLVMFSSYFIFFLGFQSLSNLQTTLNSEQGIGVDSQALIYASSMISSILLPNLLIKTIGCKWTLVSMFLCSLPYMISNYKPSFGFMMPSSILMGAAISPLNTAGAFYINEMSLRYHTIDMSESMETILARFFGILSFFQENTQIWGNLVSYYILRPATIPLTNQTNITCGINFVKNPNGNGTNPNLQPPSAEKRYILITIYVLSAVIAASLMGFFLDKLENDIQKGKRGQCKEVLWRLLAAAKHAILPDQILLLPMSIFFGLELAFYTGEITEAFIACSWGVHHVGLVTICFGVCGALMSLLVGPLVKCISLMAVLFLATIAYVFNCVVLFLWEPTPEFKTIYFVIAGIWGMADAIWWSQVAALYGLMFPNDREAAFSNLYFWCFFGFFLSYSYANYFTMTVKIYILLCFLFAGMLGYMIGQIKLKCSTSLKPKKDTAVCENSAL
ncbi:unnamed protein product [Larinioides sclopetarius]|uniref:UNC93-like protein n=1 Tax=Larinioides sclopetarius TaxID=280406 RepID=A0AAV2ATR3_9ARAC